MPESTPEQLEPPSQETLDAIWDRVTNLAKGGYQPSGREYRTKTLDRGEDIMHPVSVTIDNEIGEKLYPTEALATIRFEDLQDREKSSLYYFHKNKISGEKRLEKDIPPSGRASKTSHQLEAVDESEA